MGSTPYPRWEVLVRVQVGPLVLKHRIDGRWPLPRNSRATTGVKLNAQASAVDTWSGGNIRAGCEAGSFTRGDGTRG